MLEVARAQKHTRPAPIASASATPHDCDDHYDDPAHRQADALDTVALGDEAHHASVILAGATKSEPRKSRRLQRIALPLLGLVAAVTYVALAKPAALGLPPRYVLDRELLARNLGLGIDQVALAGHRFTVDADVFDALDLANVRSFLSFDAKAAKARIERLPWVATAELTRVFPGRLDIRITERKAFAIWTRGDRRFLIDDTGRTLTAVSGSSLPTLPRVAGEGAAGEAKPFLDLIANFPDIASRLVEAERIGERRWDVKLKDGIVLRLPADGEVQVLDEITRSGELSRLAATANTIMDLRAPGRAAVRTEQPPATLEPLAVGLGTGS